MKKIRIEILIILMAFIMYFSGSIKYINAEMIMVDFDGYEYRNDTDFGFVTADYKMSSLVQSDGTVFVWGSNYLGQLGDGTIINRNVGVDITNNYTLEDGEKIEKLRMSNTLSLALSSNNRVFMKDAGDTTTVSDITSIFGLSPGETIIEVFAEGTINGVFTSEGRIFTWGENYAGQVGDGTTIDRTLPVDITSNFILNPEEVISSVSIGDDHSLALTSFDRVFAWGYNAKGEVGDATFDNRPTPVDITGEFSLADGETITKIFAEENNSAAITSLGNLFTWGDNSEGQMADGTFVNKNVPTDVTSNYGLNQSEKISNIAFGYYHSIAYTSANRVLSCGNNDYGQLGSVNFESRTIPVVITNNFALNSGERIIQVTAGVDHTIVLTNHARVFSWGDNHSFQLGSGTDFHHSTRPLYIRTDKLIINDIPYGELPALSNIKMFDIPSKIVYTDSEIIFSIYPSNDLYPYLQTITINSIAYGSSYFTNNGGRIDVTIPNVYDVDDVITFDIELFTFFDDSTSSTGGMNSEVVSFVEDIEPPTFDYISNKIIEAGTADIDWTNSIFNETDNSSGPLTKVEVTDNTDYDTPGTYSVTVKVVDEGLNETSRLFNVTIEDTTAPSFDLIGDQYIEAGIDGNQDWTTYVTNLTDNSDGTITLVEADFVFYEELGTYTSTVTATDASGNEYSETFNVNVNDFTAPDLIYTGDYIFEINSIKPSFISLFNSIDAFDGDVSFNLIVEDNTDFTTIGTYTVSANCQDTHINFAYLEITITIEDTTAPTFDTIPTQYIQAGVDGNQDWTTYMENLFDNSDGTITTFETDYVFYDDLGWYSVTVTATDEADNSTSQTFDVQVIDTLVPDLTYTGDYTFEINSVHPDFESLFDAIDAFDGDVSFNLNVIDNTDFAIVGTYIVSAGCQDTHLNFTYMEITISIEDTIAPTFDTISDQYIEIGVDTNKDWTTYMNNLFDNSNGIITLLEMDGIMYDVLGFYHVTVYATDEEDNQTSQTFSAEVIDTKKPDLAYTGLLVFEINSTPPDFYDLFTAIDIYEGDVSFYLNVYDYSDFTELGTYTVSADVHDTSLNMNFLEITITIVDTTTPTFDNINDQTIESELNNDVDWETYIENATDNSNHSLTEIEVEDNVDYDTPGTYFVTVKLVDESLNEYSQTFTVTVVDTTHPTIEACLGYTNYVFEATQGDAPVDSYTIYVCVTDENSDTNLITEETYNDVDYNTPGTYSVDLRVTDGSGNYSEIYLTITIEDTSSPTIEPIADQTIEAGSINEEDLIFIINALDNSDGLITISLVENNVEYYTVGTYTVTYKLTDESGNEASYTFTVIVEDTSPPSFDPIEDEMMEVGSTNIDWSSIIENATDNSDSVLTFLEVEDNVDYNTLGTYTVTVSVKDESLNVISVTFNVTIEDTTLPVIYLPSVLEINEDIENPNWLNGVTGFDNYDGDKTAEIIVDASEVDINQPGVYPISFYLEDILGNTRIINTTITVIDITPPEVALNPGRDTIRVGDTFVDYGITVFDNADDNPVIVVTNTGTEVSVFWITEGVYEISYVVTDVSGNTTRINRFVNVLPSDPVLVFELDPALTTIPVGDTYIDSACNVYVDNVLEACTKLESNIDKDVAGIYTVTYSVEVNETIYTFDRYIFIYEDGVDLTLYYRKEEEVYSV